MRKHHILFPLSLTLFSTALALGQGDTSQKSPEEELPAHITRLTHFGQRADWSHDGKKILFLERTFGDAFEIDAATKIIRPLTHHFYHEGFTRALYLPNGDILLSGARKFDASDPWPSRRDKAELWVLSRNLDKPPVPLGTKCSEGPAVSRKRMSIAWTIDHSDYPDRLPEETHQIWTGDIKYQNGIPRLVNKKMVLDSRKLPFKVRMETQNFRPPDEKEIIFSGYEFRQGEKYSHCEVLGVNIETGEVRNYSNSNARDEPEGIYPDGLYTLVEADRHNPKGRQYIDVYKLSLDGSEKMERLTYFNDYEGFKASNPVVSDDGRFIAFQMAFQGDPSGVGRGIFIYDIGKAPRK